MFTLFADLCMVLVFFFCLHEYLCFFLQCTGRCFAFVKWLILSTCSKATQVTRDSRRWMCDGRDWRYRSARLGKHSMLPFVFTFLYFSCYLPFFQGRFALHQLSIWCNTSKHKVHLLFLLLLELCWWWPRMVMQLSGVKNKLVFIGF